MTLLDKLANADLRSEEYLRSIEQKLDDKIGELTDDTNFSKKLEEAEKFARKTDEDTLYALKKQCKHDLFFLAFSICQYDRLSSNLHGHLCTWLLKNKYERYVEVLLPRGLFKSTLVTICRNLQRVLPFELESEPYPWNLGPNIRILITHEVATMASGYVTAITSHLMSNPFIMALFPEIVPNPKKHRINKSEVELPRTLIAQEATIMAGGVGMRSQGWHFDHFTFDDIFGEKARDSEVEANTIKNWFDGTPGFRVKLSKSTFDVVGTRWGPEDVYGHIEETYGKALKVYRRGIEEENVITGLKESIFPEEIASEDLVVLKKNAQVFNSQYMNDPQGGDKKFDPAWIKRYLWDGDNAIISPAIIDKDGHTIKFKERFALQDLYKVLLIDPAITGNTGWAVTGTDWNERHYVLEARQADLTPSQQVSLMFDMHLKYNLHMIAIENDLFMQLYQEWLPREMMIRNQRFPITGVPTNQKSKPLRVLGLSTYLMAGQLWLNNTRYSKTQDRQEEYDDLEYQIRKFGSIKEYHILDAIAHGPKVWMRGFNPELRRMQENSVSDRLKDSRSATTGYSKIKYATRR
jgi:hypothetical protein